MQDVSPVLSMRRATALIALIAALAFGAMAVSANSARAAGSIVVNKLVDDVDPSDGICTLREAIISANTNTASGPASGECAAGAVGTDDITFAESGSLVLNGTALPNITEDLKINADGQVQVSGDDLSGVFVIDSANVTLDGLHISNGNAVDGAGVFVSNGTVTIQASLIAQNHATGKGGGVYAMTSSKVNIFDSLLEENSGDGGGIYVTGNSDLDLKNSAIDDNTSTTGTAGILMDSFSTFEIGGTTINGNETSEGTGAAGGIRVITGAAGTVADSEISGNENTAATGSRASAVAVDSTVGTSLTIERTTISGNTTRGQTVVTSGIVTIVNSTISGNTANIAVHAIGSANMDVTILHTTITGTMSLAGTDGRGIRVFASGGALTIGASVIAGNAATDYDIDANTAATLDSEGFNVIGTIDDQGNHANLTATDLVDVDDPGLEPLANNGGSTNTHALSPGSPARDLVTGALSVPFSADQRGVARPQSSAPDAGAFELVVPGLTVMPDPCVIYDSVSATAAGLGGKMIGSESREVQVTGTLANQGGAASCVPVGASSVVFRISSIDPLTEGNLLMTPAGVAATGSAGVVNYGAANGLNNANTVTVPVSAAGAVDIEANTGPAGPVPTTDVRLVAIAYYSPDVAPDLKYFAVNPCPVADSRTNQGANDDFDGPDNDGLWPVEKAYPDIDVVGTFLAGQGGGQTDCGVPDSADAVLLNVVAVNMEGGSGHLSVGSGGTDPVDEATTPFAVLTPKMNNGATTIVNVGPGGTVAVDIDGDPAAATMIRVEVLGYYDNNDAGLDFFDVTPCAVFDTRTNQGAANDFAGPRKHGVAYTTVYEISGDSVPLEQGGVVDGGNGAGSCEVPTNAEAVLINLEAVNAVREGNFWVSAAGTTTTGGVLNFNNVVPKMNNANAVVVPLDNAGFLALEINAGAFTPVGTEVADARGVVLGYFN